MTLPEAIVGLSPGRTGEFVPVDLSANGPTGGGGGAVGERFAEQAQLDTVEVARKFYQSHPDNYDQLVIWTDATVVDDAFAYEVTVANEMRGIGLSQFDASRDFGSAGRLRSYAVMDWIGKYPEDPLQTFLGENSTVSVLGQEVGHRWLAFLEFRNHTGARSEALLGRDQAHWSFFMDSDASVMEGNDIEDLGGGSFRTTAPCSATAGSISTRWDSCRRARSRRSSTSTIPVNVAGGREADSAPRVGVTFNGTRRDVLIEDVIAINGPRIPSSADSARVHRQAFLLVVGQGRSADNAQIAKIDRIRQGVGEVLPAGHRGPDAGDHDVAVAQRIILLPMRAILAAVVLLSLTHPVSAPAGSEQAPRLTVASPVPAGTSAPTEAQVTVGRAAARRHRAARAGGNRREEAARRRRPRRPRRSDSLPEGDRKSCARPRGRADDGRHDLRSGVADQGRRHDDQRDDARRAGPHPAERPRRGPTCQASSVTARAISPSVTC